jgi:hypothetical protein
MDIIKCLIPLLPSWPDQSERAMSRHYNCFLVYVSNFETTARNQNSARLQQMRDSPVIAHAKPTRILHAKPQTIQF